MNFDDNQHVIMVRIRKGTNEEYEADFKQCFHHNIKVILKYFETLMAGDKIEHSFGFSSVKEMLDRQKSNYYTDVPPFVSALESSNLM
jgi:hypothetical protein